MRFFAENINDPTKAIAKWRNHPSILAIGSEYKNRANFSFNFVSKEDVVTETRMLDVSKAIQESDITVKINKANENSFAEVICFYFNKSLENGKFAHCLLLMLEIYKEATNSNKAFGALLTDFLKAFDCLSHGLLIAKLHAYGIDINSLNILQDYLSNRKQRTKVVPQRSIFGPLLFNIFMCDMFLILKSTYFTGYADDITPFAVSNDML